MREAETVGATAPPDPARSPAAGVPVRRPLRLRAADCALMASALLPAAALLA
jgi:hypothetical protein